MLRGRYDSSVNLNTFCRSFPKSSLFLQLALLTMYSEKEKVHFMVRVQEL